jgi:hypothetical protein
MTRTLQPIETASSLPIGGIQLSQYPFDESRIHESGVLDYLNDSEIDTLQSPAMSHFRQMIVANCVELDLGLGGKLTEADFKPKYELDGIPKTLERALYIPEVKINGTDLSDLLPFSGMTTNVVTSAIDVFPTSAPKGEAIRICDLRELAGVNADEEFFQVPANRKKLETRFVNDIAGLFIKPNGPTVKGIDRAVRYSKSPDDKLRTYYRSIATDPTVQTDGYKVAQTIVRLADCATGSGEASIYRRLFGMSGKRLS